MRYALTFTLGGFERTDTIIVEVSGDPAKHIFGDEAKDIEEALEKGTGWGQDEINEVISNKSYYLRSVDDIDAYIKR